MVFSYFTDPEKYRIWQGHEAELDPRPGGMFRVLMSEPLGTIARGMFLEVESPRRIVYTWGWEQQDWFPDGVRVDPGSSRVEVTLERDGDNTILRLLHSGLPTDAACDFHSGGWDLTLDRLVIAAEGGDPGPNPFDEFRRPAAEAP